MKAPGADSGDAGASPVLRGKTCRAQPTSPAEAPWVRKAAQPHCRGQQPPAGPAAEPAAASASPGKTPAGRASGGLRAPPEEARHRQRPGEVSEANLSCVNSSL